MKQVVGVAFIKEGKLLVSQSVRSSKSGIFTFVGGGVEEGETILEAAVRECREEIGNGFEITENDFEPVLIFMEGAASDPNQMVEIHILIAKKTIDVPLNSNEEIVRYRWFSLGDNESILSSSIREHFLPFAKEKGLLY